MKATKPTHDPGEEQLFGELYDALTLEVEQAETLTGHVEERLSDLSAGEGGELFALSIVAREAWAKHQRIRDTAGKLRDVYFARTERVNGNG